MLPGLLSPASCVAPRGDDAEPGLLRTDMILGLILPDAD